MTIWYAIQILQEMTELNIIKSTLNKNKANELGEGNAAVEADVPEDQQDLQGQGAPFLPAMLEQVQANPSTKTSCSY